MVLRFKHFALVLDLAFLPIILNNLFIRSHSFSISKIYFYYKKKWKLHSFIDTISDVLRNSSSQNLQGKSLNSWLKIIIRNTNVRLLFLNLILHHCNCSRLTSKKIFVRKLLESHALESKYIVYFGIIKTQTFLSVYRA